jgi:hypothetical protein
VRLRGPLLGLGALFWQARACAAPISTYPLAALTGAHRMVGTLGGATVQVTPAQIGAYVSATPVGLDPTGVTDDTAIIQAALNTGAPVVTLPPGAGAYKVTGTLLLATNQILTGPPRAPIYNGLANVGATILCRPASHPFTCIKNANSLVANGTTGNGVTDLSIDTNSDQDFAVGFLNSFGNVVKRVTFTGTADVDLFVDLSYVPVIEDVSFASVAKHYYVYLGDTDAATVNRLYSGAYPDSNSVPLVGVGLKAGHNSVISNAVLQNMTIGISLRNPINTRIDTPYFENVLCLVRFGDPTYGNPGRTIRMTDATVSEASSEHPQFAQRGPLLYLSNADNVMLENTGFYTSHATDANIWPVLADVTTGPVTMVGNYWNDGAARTDIFRSVPGTNPAFTIVGEPMSSNGGTEIIVHDSDAGSYHGITINAAGTISGATWSPPVISGSVNALLTGAFYVPTLP